MGALADRMLEFNFGGAKILFEKALEKGAEIIEHAPLPTRRAEEAELKLEPPHVESDDQFHPANVNRHVLRADTGEYRIALPKSARHILSSLELLDNLLFEIGDSIGIDAADASSVAYALAAQRKMPKAYVDLYQSLREARNVIAHTNTMPNKTEASEYTRQVNFLIEFLSEVKNNLGKEKPR